jgi:hypothetical protein
VQRLAGKAPNATRELGPVRPLCYCTHIHYGRISICICACTAHLPVKPNTSDLLHSVHLTTLSYQRSLAKGC